MNGTLETILEEILKHDREHPDHGVGCICIDEHARKIRVLMSEKGFNKPGNSKSKQNLRCALSYIARWP